MTFLLIRPNFFWRFCCRSNILKIIKTEKKPASIVSLVMFKKNSSTFKYRSYPNFIGLIFLLQLFRQFTRCFLLTILELKPPLRLPINNSRYTGFISVILNGIYITLHTLFYIKLSKHVFQRQKSTKIFRRILTFNKTSAFHSVLCISNSAYKVYPEIF